MKKKIPYLLLSIFLLIVCILIVVLFSSNQFIRGFLGDSIIVMLMYTSIKCIKFFDSLKLCFTVILFSYLIEFTQYIKIISILGFKENLFTKIVFGSVFDPMDLLAYTIGGVLIYTIDTKLIQKKII